MREKKDAARKGVDGPPPHSKEEEAYREIDRIDEESNKSLPMPARFPATLRDFYRLVVKARTVADNQARFRKFLCLRGFGIVPEGQQARAREEKAAALEAKGLRVKRGASFADQASKWATKRFEEINCRDKAGGFFNKRGWQETALAYLEWWKRDRSEQNSKNAKKRKPAT